MYSDDSNVGAAGRIRTVDQLVNSQTLHRTELRRLRPRSICGKPILIFILGSHVPNVITEAMLKILELHSDYKGILKMPLS